MRSDFPGPTGNHLCWRLRYCFSVPNPPFHNLLCDAVAGLFTQAFFLLPACSPAGFCPLRVLERLWAQQWAFAPAVVALPDSSFFNMPRTSLTLPFQRCQHLLGFFLRDLPATPRGSSSKFLGFANPSFFLSFPQFQVVVSTSCGYYLSFCPISPPIPIPYIILPLL